MSRRLFGSRAVSVAVASMLSSTLVAAPVFAATATPEPTPTAAVEETPETTSTEVPTEPFKTPKENAYSVGQSVQVRTNADGTQNSGLANFRWSITQVTVQGSEDGPTDVPVPEGGNMLRSLQDFSHPSQEDGVATMPVDIQDGFGLARTVSLVPGDFELAAGFKASFTLDGEPISANDLVGKSGVVTAKYTVSNNTTKKIKVEVKDLTGKVVEKEVEAQVPMIVIAKTLLPTRFTGLATGSGQFGADGRGNNQVQWVGLPFAPLSKAGEATFGWAANVRDAVLPSMLVQVAPIYIPESDEDAGPAVPGSGGGSAAPNLDPAIAQISAGVAQLIQGLEGFAAAGGGGDPLDAAEAGLENFFQSFGANLQALAKLVDPNNPDSATSIIKELLAGIEKVEASGALDAISQAADILTPENAAALQKAIGPVNSIAENAGSLVTGIKAGCLPGPAQVLPDEVCDNKAALISALESAALQTAAGVLTSLDGKIEPAAAALQTIEDLLPGAIAVLKPLLVTFDQVLSDLSVQVGLIAGGLSSTDVNLPALDAVISNIVSTVLSSPPGTDLTEGLGLVGAGLGDVKTILADFIAQALVTLSGVAEGADEAVVELKATLGAVIKASHASPLPYGGDPSDAPPNTVLAGAFEFRVDAADGNWPNTPWRVLLGLLALLGGGFVASKLIGRNGGEPAVAMPDGPSDGPGPELAMSGAALGGAGLAASDAPTRLGGAFDGADTAASNAGDAATSAIPSLGDDAQGAAEDVSSAVEDAAGTLGDEGPDVRP